MDHRPDLEDPSRAKRQKTRESDMDPSKNPYLAHMYSGRNGVPLTDGSSGTLSNSKRHNSNASMAKLAEDGPHNPFNSKPFSQQYFNILHGRRNLPVHAQRYVYTLGNLHIEERLTLSSCNPGMSSSISITNLRSSSSSVRLDQAKPRKYLSSFFLMTCPT